ncbi:hypothetical protein ACPOL_3080 [Acidisarcina polymorpha]|uniref:Uncharacterized protein n=1 Tax=Acidisarcina polymorpha TaxID=2211140 RepID=A0A2Z5G0Y9_9BACT|nr:hypothetical protein ACPOL_3080 [Acidisarcina polymorpha]
MPTRAARSGGIAAEENLHVDAVLIHLRDTFRACLCSELRVIEMSIGNGRCSSPSSIAPLSPEPSSVNSLTMSKEDKVTIIMGWAM